MGEYEIFKTTLMGGYDKDDVQEQFQKIKDETASEQVRMQKEIETRDDKIAELMKRLETKDKHQERLEAEINEKYQKYIDNYDSIGRLVFEAQIKSDQIMKTAQIKSEEMMKIAQTKAEEMVKAAGKKSHAILKSAKEEADKRIESVQIEVDEKLSEGKKKYIAVQEEMNEIVELINQAQKRFMSSYREVHKIISTMPTSIRDIEEVMKDELPIPPIPPIPVEAAEVHLGDTQELEVLDVIEDIEDLDEYDGEDAINEKLVNTIRGFLEDDSEDSALSSK